MLYVENLTIHYGSIIALKGISFSVQAGEIVTLIGANGAGKTSCLHGLSGVVQKTAGTVRFLNEDISKFAPHEIVKLGLVQVPEGRRVFANLSVYENLEMGAFVRTDRKEIKQDIAFVFELFPRLQERKKQQAGTLSGGEQQMLAIGRALMGKPTLLLLDEPSMGLAPILVDEIFRIIQSINERGTTILLVEQNAYKALHIADRAYILETGSIIQTDSAKALLHDPVVQKAYLGV